MLIVWLQRCVCSDTSTVLVCFAVMLCSGDALMCFYEGKVSLLPPACYQLPGNSLVDCVPGFNEKQHRACILLHHELIKFRF